MRSIRIFFATLVFGACLAAACTGSGNGQSLPLTATTTPTTTVTQTSDVQTGIAPVDRFLNLVGAGDFARIAAEAVYNPIECESDPLIADYPLRCAEGEPDGTVTYGIGVGCLPYVSIYTQDELAARIERLGKDGMEIEAVYTTTEGGDSYALSFIDYGSPPALAVSRITVFLTEDGRLESYASCGEYLSVPASATQVWP